MTMADFTTRDVAIIAAGIIVATVLTVIATWFLVGIFAPSDPLDPLTKAGGLKRDQDIRKK